MAPTMDDKRGFFSGVSLSDSWAYVHECFLRSFSHTGENYHSFHSREKGADNMCSRYKI
jgi:hypothetical protein